MKLPWPPAFRFASSLPYNGISQSMAFSRSLQQLFPWKHINHDAVP
jgi:hypothetical protein